MTAAASSAWADAALAAALVAIDPSGLGGVVVRAGPGAVRDRWTQMTRSLLPADTPVRRIPLNIEDDRLLGGLDLPASLAAGRPVAQSGILAQSDGGVVILAMAERIEPTAAARIATALDRGEVAVERDGLTLRLAARIGVIAFDEGVAPEERPPQALLDRLAFHLDLSLVGARDAVGELTDPAEIARARAGLAQIAPADHAVVEALCMAARSVGLDGARAPLLTLRAARAHAALQGREVITAEDAAAAARLVLGPRARIRPEDAAPEAGERPQADADPPPDPPMDRPDDAPSDGAHDETADRVIAAVAAVLPDDLLERIKLDDRSRAAARSSGSGAAAKSARRGRPVGSRPGPLRPGARLNLVETLRAAAPWQTLRGGGGDQARIQVRPDDFRIRRFVQRRESTTIFVVDASGSQAFQRLGEAKGAVELLLAKAYVSRARVALIAFRGTDAELLLPPTRSLTRAKVRLAELPGGGATPLAAGVEAALALAMAERAKDHTPLIVLLTDGRGNIARNGAPGRAQAGVDALAAASQVREAGVAAVFIDTSPRAQPDGDRLAVAMGAAYAPLPYVDAEGMADLVGQLQGPRPVR